jgi:hypothetical protein
MTRFESRTRKSGWRWTSRSAPLRSKTYHRNAGIRLPNSRLHATFHAIVENQAGLGDDAPVQKALERLINEGIDRHEAMPSPPY